MNLRADVRVQDRRSHTCAAQKRAPNVAGDGVESLGDGVLQCAWREIRCRAAVSRRRRPRDVVRAHCPKLPADVNPPGGDDRIAAKLCSE